ncbi:hypothetical protein [Streptantibioticus ferralitis]|uniref:DNA primase n=1 Tax=Streptantibioticus ferralitis TaxID=236510 RepID=A0ABT5ZBC1_9ACTN|nr:hypothetical protein [Streptantibioticus ferralitis]MDF2260927.1 hypothetical protein [Streptantibioticus ferralitis]
MTATHSHDVITSGGVHMTRALHGRDPIASAQAYNALGWPVMIGHRWRRGPGCTCGQGPACPTPGAHPIAQPSVPLTADQIPAALEAAPGAALITSCTAFDAVVMPRALGMALMVLLDHYHVPAPCLTVDHTTATVLVAPQTAYGLCGGPCTVRRGGADWIALPPSYGIRWDTPPTCDVLPTGERVRPHLAQVLKLAGSGEAGR